MAKMKVSLKQQFITDCKRISRYAEKGTTVGLTKEDHKHIKKYVKRANLLAQQLGREPVFYLDHQVAVLLKNQIEQVCQKIIDLNWAGDIEHTDEWQRSSRVLRVLNKLYEEMNR